MRAGPPLTLADIRALAEIEATPTVSLYLPTHVAGRDTAQDPIRLRNLLGEAADRLHAAGHRRADVRHWLQPAYALAGDAHFWRHQNHGLAVIATSTLSRHTRLPFPVPERVVVAQRPHLRPLLPLLGGCGGFHILAASSNGARLYEASRYGCMPVEAELPQGVASVIEMTEYEHSHHASPPARPRAAPAIRMVGAQIFGDSPEEAQKIELLEYARRLGSAVAQRLAGREEPVVLVAQAELQGHLRKLTTGLAYIDGGIDADPQSLEEDELHRRAHALVEPVLTAAERRDRDRLTALMGRSDPRAVVGLEAVLPAAAEGRVATLFVDPDASRPDTAMAPPDDPIDRSVALALLHRGRVLSLEQGTSLPGDAPIAAILRY